MIWLFVLGLLLAYIIIGTIVSGIVFRFEGEYDPEKDQGLATACVILWPVIICIAFAFEGLPAIGEFFWKVITKVIPKLFPTFLLTKLFHFSRKTKPWSDWKEYVIRKSS